MYSFAFCFLIDSSTQLEKEEGNLEVLLMNCIENYCVSVNTKITHPVLQEALSQSPENHVILFWKSVNDKATEDSGERAI